MNRQELQGFDISGFSAAVIGCGGLGCNVAVHLAGAGIGRLFLADYDTVSESNLNRQFLYTADDIGKSKAGLAAERLKKYSAYTQFTAVNKKIGNIDDLKFAENCDIIFLAVDNNAARRVLQSFCAGRNIPLVNGGINGFCGTAYLYVPDKTPCLDCAGITGKESGRIFSVSSTAGIIGALEVELGIKYLSDSKTDIAGILHIYDNGEINKLKIKTQENCGLCGVKKNV